MLDICVNQTILTIKKVNDVSVFVQIVAQNAVDQTSNACRPIVHFIAETFVAQ